MNGQRCPACGVRYRAWRSPFSGNPKGAIATPNGAKAWAWAQHVATCDAYPSSATDFDPMALAAPTMPRSASGDVAGRTVGFERGTLLRVAYADVDPMDDFGGESEAEAEWSARYREARMILGADFARVTEAA